MKKRMELSGGEGAEVDEKRGKKKQVITVIELKCGQHCALSSCSCNLIYYFLLAVKGLEHNVQATGVNTGDINISSEGSVAE